MLYLSEIPERVRKFFETEGIYAEKMIIGNNKIPLVESYYLESYSHEWLLNMYSFKHSGVELETLDYYSTIVLLSILTHYDIDYRLKRDATSFAEFTLTLADYIKIIKPLERLRVRFVSTHVHSSSPLVYFLLRDYANYKYLPSFVYPNEAKKVFGRKFTSYADSAISFWKYHRYGMLTFPKMECQESKFFIELSSANDRPTVEFRITKLDSCIKLKRFLLFIIMWYIFETKTNKRFMREPFLKAIESTARIDTKSLRKITCESLIERIKRFEAEVINRHEFYFKIGSQEPFKPVFSIM